MNQLFNKKWYPDGYRLGCAITLFSMLIAVVGLFLLGSFIIHLI